MPSLAVIVPRRNPIQRWRAHGLGDEFWHSGANLHDNRNTERGLSEFYVLLRCSQISAGLNERRTSWKDEEFVENEPVSCKRCHTKNKKTRVRQPPRSRKPAQHHVNSINSRQSLVLGAPVHVFQHRSKLGQENGIHSLCGPSGPLPSLAR